jgi:outer membrane protein OmpA-like peptidoglycan-associated protein
MKNLLQKNPEVIIMVDAYCDEDNRDRANDVFQKVAQVGKMVKSKLEDPLLADRVYIHQSFRKGGDPKIIMVFPVSEGILFRPKEGDHVINEIEVEGDDMNLVRIEATVQAGIDSFAVTIVDSKGQLVRNLIAGTGQIPVGVAWDWSNNSGDLLDFDDSYFVKFEVSDKLGEHFVTKSDTMAIQITKEAKRIESLVIVEFIFNEDNPESKFLASRVEYVAKRLIQRGSSEYTIVDAVVTGHTDSIGAEYANIELSNQRATRELTQLRRYMMYLLDLKTPADLDNWLAQRNVRLTTKGYGESRPYKIIRWSPTGAREEIILGDNSMPEGRVVNRRVLLEMRSERRID